MPIFVYKGYDIKTGAQKKGKVEADSMKAARQVLRSKEKVIPAEIKEELAVGSAKSSGRLFAKKTVAMVDVAIMTRQFATLQAAQVPLDECLKALTEQVEDVLLRNTLSAIREGVSEGKSLGVAMAEFPNIFDNLYVNMVKAGEMSGKLDVVLERLADFIEYQVEVQGKIVSAMAYPGIMIGMSVLIITYLFTSVVPKLQKVFVTMKVKLPWYTESIIGVSEFIQHRWYIIIGALALIVFLFKSWHASEGGRRTFDTFSLKVPIFGGITTRVNISKFTKTLSTLLSSGVPIISALDITKNVISNKILSDVVENSKIAVQEGNTLASVLGQSDVFPPLVSHMISTGEKTGELETMLQHVAKAYDAEVERKIEAMISLIEPLMIVFLGGVVVVIVLAMLIPMFSVMGQMR